MNQTRAGRNQSDTSITDQAAAMAHDTVDRAAEVANDAEQEVRRAAARRVKQAREFQDHAREMAEEKVDRLRSYAKKNPLTTAGIAFAIGVVVSALIRR